MRRDGYLSVPDPETPDTSPLPPCRSSPPPPGRSAPYIGTSKVGAGGKPAPPRVKAAALAIAVAFIAVGGIAGAAVVLVSRAAMPHDLHPPDEVYFSADPWYPEAQAPFVLKFVGLGTTARQVDVRLVAFEHLCRAGHPLPHNPSFVASPVRRLNDSTFEFLLPSDGAHYMCAHHPAWGGAAVIHADGHNADGSIALKVKQRLTDIERYMELCDMAERLRRHDEGLEACRLAAEEWEYDDSALLDVQLTTADLWLALGDVAEAEEMIRRARGHPYAADEIERVVRREQRLEKIRRQSLLADPYELLGVGRSAGKAEIRRAFKQRKERQLDAETQADVLDYSLVHAAYELLLNDRRRNLYDAGDTAEAGWRP